MEYDEKELLLDYKKKRESHEEFKRYASAAYQALQEAERKIIEFLEDTGRETTAKYEGIGKLTLGKPQLYAKYDDGDRDNVFEFLKQNGMEDVIKESVHHATLSSFVANQLIAGEQVPEFIKTSYRKTVRFNSN